MPYTVDDVQRLFKLLGQAVWYTQHLELVMTQYNALMNLKILQESGEFLNEEAVRNALITKKTQTLGKLVAVAKEQGILSREFEESFRIVIKTREWILYECVCDHHLSFRKQNSTKHFFRIIEAYIKDIKAMKTEMLYEMEAWLKKKGYDLHQVYQLRGKL